MRSSEFAARLLMQGLLDDASWPEFAEDTFREDVRGRLAAVGYELGLAEGYWLARTRETEAVDGFKQVLQLNEADYAVLAALYLHLRFLPRQSQGLAGLDEEPSVAVEEIERGFPSYRARTVRMILGHLRNLHCIRQYNSRYYPGPYLAVIDELVADERAKEALRDFKLRSHWDRALAALEVDLDASN